MVATSSTSSSSGGRPGARPGARMPPPRPSQRTAPRAPPQFDDSRLSTFNPNSRNASRSSSVVTSSRRRGVAGGGNSRDRSGKRAAALAPAHNHDSAPPGASMTSSYGTTRMKNSSGTRKMRKNDALLQRLFSLLYVADLLVVLLAGRELGRGSDEREPGEDYPMRFLAVVHCLVSFLTHWLLSLSPEGGGQGGSGGVSGSRFSLLLRFLALLASIFFMANSAQQGALFAGMMAVCVHVLAGALISKYYLLQDVDENAGVDPQRVGQRGKLNIGPTRGKATKRSRDRER